MRKKSRYSLFVLYGLMLTIGLLYFCFPSETVREYMESEANQANPRIMVSLGDVKPSLALGLKFEEARIFWKDKPDRPLLTTNNLLIQPGPLAFIRGKRKYNFECASGNGTIEGWLELSQDADKDSMSASTEIRGVSIQNFIDASAIAGREVEGILRGTFSYSGKKDLMMAGAGQADLRISDGKLLLSQPVLGLDAVRFDEVMIQMTFRNMSVNLTRVELFGQQLQGALSGTISLRRDISASRLNLRGTVEPFAALFDGENGADETLLIIRQRLKQGRLSFVITGTLAEPKIRFV